MTVVVVGVPAVLDALRDMPEIALPAFRDAAESSLLSLLPDLASYPSPPRGSRYIRTGTLGRLWTTARPEWDAGGGGWSASVMNATPYGMYVQGEKQARVHAGRWRTVEDVVKANQSQIERQFERAVQRVVARINERIGG